LIILGFEHGDFVKQLLSLGFLPLLRCHLLTGAITPHGTVEGAHHVIE
jgi:hypothetical protein